MNERIRQLALEAFQPINDITTEGVADRHTFDQAWFQHYNKKFAELIVRECAHLVDTLNEAYGAPSTAGEFIKEQFGVSE
jgi:lysophospholipase L1-like esterase